MRPLRLQLKGFTSFRDEQELDFEGLDLFAISGPTGSGKSSLLDAMTYALFGTVERVGKQVGQLVSQGQPSMSVMFDFEVDGERWRVTRKTPSNGASKILLEAWNGAEWGQAGEGSDKVRDVNARIASILGLDYDAFSRSVVLPQGQFAEFLVGDAKQRRDILKELLGLELFDRLAKRAGAVRNLSRETAKAREDLLEKEYAGITPQAIDEALARADAADEAQVALAAAETTVKEHRARSTDVERAATAIRTLIGEVGSVAAVASDARDRLATIAKASASGDAVLAQATKASANAAKAAAASTKAREKAEASSGGLAQLGKLQALANRLADHERTAGGAVKQITAGKTALAKLEVSLAKRSQDLARAEIAAQEAGAAIDQARAAHEVAMHDDVVATVRAGAKVGEPCPVCGEPITTMPKGRAAAGAAEKAKKAVAAAEKKAQAAAKTLSTRQRDRDEDAASIDRTRRELDALEQAMADEVKAVAADRKSVVAVTGKATDPVAEIASRIDALTALVDAERTATEAATAAERARVGAERDTERAIGEAAEIAARLASQPLGPLSERVAALDRGIGALSLPSPVPKEPDALAAAADELSRTAAEVTDALDERAVAAASGAAEILTTARTEIADALTGGAAAAGANASTLGELEEVVAAERRSQHAAAATARADAERLRERLVRGAELAKEVEEIRERAARFEALAKELRADKVIAFLQQEALMMLAVAASRHLATLSSDRYRLLFQEEEFYVIDTWNGEEARRARTLSGGETFLASLALALALSEEVRSLSVTERARMDSLFLDEGFGTLDPETLETVVDAIEQLGGDGRMVGVITHVQELAVRLPARIEVEKSPRGSRFSVRV